MGIAAPSRVHALGAARCDPNKKETGRFRQRPASQRIKTQNEVNTLTHNHGTPFAETAAAYHLRGWHPFPLWDIEPSTPNDQRARGKNSPPKGFTGRGAVNADRDQIEAWLANPRFHNLGTRMPDTVIVIDVDAYHGGSETLAALEKAHGKLPKTYTVTARTDGSGHRYYSVPSKRVWRNPGKGIEILHWGWRYAVLPPSIHPDTGTPYLWFGPDGVELVNQLGPKLDSLPPLPRRWITYLDTKADPDIIAPRIELGAAEANTLVADWVTDDEPCWHMLAALDEVRQAHAGRHDACMRAQMKILRYAEAIHPGGKTALRQLQAWFYSAMGADRDPSSEWARGIANAAGKIAATPTPESRQGCAPIPPMVPLREITLPSRHIELPTRTINVGGK